MAAAAESRDARAADNGAIPAALAAARWRFSAARAARTIAAVVSCSVASRSLTEGNPMAPESVTTDLFSISGHDWRLGRFPDLMPRRVERILLVSSAYDAFILEEDGLLTELIFSEYMDLSLSQAPRVIRAGGGEEALSLLRTQAFDLVITMLRLGDMNVFRFTDAVRDAAPQVPVVLLISNELELARLGEQRNDLDVDSIYVWQGDAKLFLAIIKCLEDRWNAEHDTRVGGVGVIIVVEDSVRQRSSLLPMLYSELVQQTRSVMADGINRMHKQLRLRARPKLLLAETYEEAWALYELHKEYMFGIITDVRYPRRGAPDPNAGIDLIRAIKAENPDVPALLQSSDAANHARADEVKTSFLHKRSRTLLSDIREFMLRNFGFGDFIFRMPDQVEVGRAGDLTTMVRLMERIPAESIEYHARRNHFSNWLRARTEFDLAKRLRPMTVSDFQDAEELRSFLVTAFRDAIRVNRRGVVEDFSRESFDPGSSFARIGGGSLGGKARGLAFYDALLARHQLDQAFDNVRVYVPRSVVIGADVYDGFLENNQLRTNALYNARDEWIKQAFLRAPLPESVVEDLRAYLARVRSPIAVRSSSLLEDSQYYPFAGVYDTFMLPNNHADDWARLQQLSDAIKLVYASVFYTPARRYLEATPHRIEEQKMAVVLQQVVGSRFGTHFYPHFAGVGRSYNFYPFGHMKPTDGVVSVALGLGQEVVGGGRALRFCPRHPQILPQHAYPKELLRESQRDFCALDLSRSESGAAAIEKPPVVMLGLEQAERHGTLAPIGSVWSSENDALYDGIYRDGVRVVTFAHVLKSGVFPLAEILTRVLEVGREGMSGPVELEFAVNLSATPREFAILQMRPYGATGDFEPVDIDDRPRDQMICYCTQSLGNGIIDPIHDVIYVRPDAFDPGKTREMAAQIAALNDALRAENRSCVLIGPGRWGSSNRWLGIPVTWGQISAARLIVEATLDTFAVDPSQGSHFFHNLTSLGVAYLTINPRLETGFVDWAWLEEQAPTFDGPLVRHLRLARPIEARVDGRTSRGAVYKSSRRAPDS